MQCDLPVGKGMAILDGMSPRGARASPSPRIFEVTWHLEKDYSGLLGPGLKKDPGVEQKEKHTQS